MKYFSLTLMLGATLLVTANPAQATPSFSRQTQLPCQTCHAAYPELNDFGRTFKEQGYRLSFEQDPAGPWAMSTLPFAVQGSLGVTGERSAPEDSKISVDALQLFIAGPIAPRVSTYIHHHVIMDDQPGTLYEAQLRVDNPKDLPLMLRVGRFESWFAKSPGKTLLSHFGYDPLNVTVGANESTLGATKLGVGTLVRPDDFFRVNAEFYWQGQGPEGFVRPFVRVLGGEAGAFANFGSYEVTTDKVEFDDRFYRAGGDFAVFPLSWLQVSGLGYLARHGNPSGTENAVRYGSGYLELQTYIGKFAGLVRYEHLKFYSLPDPVVGVLETDAGEESMATLSRFQPLHGGEGTVTSTQGANAPTTFQWITVGTQGYLQPFVKFLAEYRHNVQEADLSEFFVGSHFAF